MKNRAFRTVCALALTLVMAFSVFACAKNGGSSGKDKPPEEQEKAKPINVFREKPVTLPPEITDTWRSAFTGGRAYFMNYAYDEKIQASTSSIVSIDMAGGDLRTHLKLVNGAQEAENVYRNKNIGAFACAEDGTIWASIDEYYSDYSDPEYPIDENNILLVHYGADSEELASIDIKALIPDAQYVYVNTMALDDKGNLVVSVETTLFVLDSATGALKFKISSEGDYPNGLVKFADGTLSAMMYDNEKGGQLFKKIDFAAKAWGETFRPNSAAGAVYFDYVMSGDGPYLFYYLKYNVGVYGMKADGTSEEIMNFINSDIDGSNISGIYRADENFVMFYYDYDEGDGRVVMSTLTRVPDGEVKEAVMLNYACVYIDYDVRRAILKFNKTNGDFRIQVTDYSEYNTEANGWTGANDRLNADIITGKIPDIISLNGLNVRNFINKGILTDIYALIDASETASREDYLPEILAAGETNGKLYSFLPSFYVQTVAAKKSIVGDRTGWTLDDLNGILRSLPAGTQSFSMMTRTDILNLCYQQAMDQFIDWDAGKCDFGENFAKLLEFVKTFPEEIDWDKIYVDESSYMDMQNAYKQDKAILQQAYVGGYRAIRDFSEQFGAEVTFVGFPTESGNGSSLIANGMDFGISARSSNKQVCFDFLAGLVQTEPNFLQSSGYFYGGFSISKAYMDKVREYELTPLRERPGYIPEDYDGGILRDRLVKYASTSSVVAVPAPVPEPDYSNGDDQLGYGPDGTMTKGEYEAGFALTQAEVDAVDRLIASAKRFYSEDTEVSNIILEEAAEFFSGRKTALDVANMIQSRVSLYVSENS